jgi:Protein of unknown function (DUF3618)
MNTSGRAGERATPVAQVDTTSSGDPPAGGSSSWRTPRPDREAAAVPDLRRDRPSDSATEERAAEVDPQSEAGEGPVDEAGLRQEIERTREQLGETVEQLAAKTDVKGRTRAMAAELARRAKSQTAQARTAMREASPEPLRRAVAKAAGTAHEQRAPLTTAAVTFFAGYLLLRWWRKR